MQRSVGLRKRSALILVIIAIVTLTVMLNVGSVHAQKLILTPNQVTQGMSVQVTGSGFYPYENANINVYQYQSGGCAGTPVIDLNAATDLNGNLQPVTISTSGLSAGTYCVEGTGFLDPPGSVNLIVNPGTARTTAVAPAIPEYFYLLLPAAFVVVVYGVIKTKQAWLE